VKKLLIPVIAGLLIGFYIYRHGVRDLFTLGAVKKVRSESVDNLKSRIKTDESEFKEDLNSAERLGSDYEKLGTKYIERKNWTPAIKSLEKAMGYGKAGSTTHYWLGLAYANRGSELNNKKDIDMAEYHYTEALKINRKLTDAEYGLSILYYYRLNRKDQALSMMKKIVASKPSYYDAHFALARYHYENGHFENSLSVYENLYTILDKRKGSFKTDALKKKCKENISLVMVQLNRK